ncbi:MAG: hypothetical protein RJQ09_11060 [Cyclobacteriaceae bacterium]
MITSRVIWFNPDTCEYEFGDVERYRIAKLNSSNNYRFQLLASVPISARNLADKVTRNLNETLNANLGIEDGILI